MDVADNTGMDEDLRNGLGSGTGGILSFFSSPAVLAFSSVVAATAYYYKTRPRPEQPLVPLDSQSPVLAGPERVHVSKVFGELSTPKKGTLASVDDGFLSYFSEDAQTLYQTFRKGLLTSENGRCLGWRPRIDPVDSDSSSHPFGPYQWLTFRETLSRAQHFGAGLKSFGLPKYALVGIYAQNCPEWIIFEQAAYCHSFVVVPLYDTLGRDSCEFIVRQTEMALVVVETIEKAHIVMDLCNESHCVRYIVVIHSSGQEMAQVAARGRKLNIEIYTFEDIESLGQSVMDRIVEEPPGPNDLATICYTSGTTGNPKGVMLTHRNIVAGCCGVLLQLGAHRPAVHDVMMSFLPLAHMLERCCENAVYYMGGAVGFYSGDIKNLNSDLQALRPTIMPAVPRLLNRVYDKIHAEVAKSAAKKFIFETAFNSKKRDLENGIVRRNTIWDRLVFKKVQDGFGGNLRLIVVGSAPLAGNVLTFMRCALGCMISEGYGQTEATAPISLTVSGDFKPEHVGPPVACNAIKLVDVPEMEYLAQNNQGEVCVRGSNVFLGYFREPELTQSVLDEDGWLHTGDIGMWLPNGTLKIIDRRKHIFKLSQGEYIVPEKIESIYLRSLYVEQVFIYGESLKSSVVGIVIPDAEVLLRWSATVAGNNNNTTEKPDLKTLCEDARVKAMVMADMLVKGKEGGLKSFEQVKDVYLHWELFSVANGLLTPTFKSKRNEIQKKFRSQLDAMYQKLD